MEEKAQTPLKAWLVLIVLSFIWGTSYILIKRGLEVYSPYQVACIRLSVSAISFLPIFLYQLNKVDWSRWMYFALVGLAGTAIPSFLFPIAQTEISSSLAGILNSLTPLFTLLMGVVLFGASTSWFKIIGVLLGLIGAGLLIIIGNQIGVDGNLWFGLFVILGTICYATSSNTVGYYMRDLNSLMISSVSFVMVGIPAVFMLLATDFTNVLQTHPDGFKAFGYIAVLALFSTVLASIIFFRLIQWTTPLFATMISYLVPIVAVFWGLIDGEPFTLLHVAGMAMILSGVYLSRR